MASGGDTKKNVILIAVTVVLLIGAAVFGFRDMLFTSGQAAESSESAAASEEIVNRITGGQPPQPQPEPDPTQPMPEPGSGRRARPAEPLK